MSTPPSYLSAEQTERVLAAVDRSKSTGRRDYAVLLLLARLGLRAGEVVTLELDDIRWRSGEIVIRGKGRMLDHLPLICDVGEALASYARNDRGVTSSRRVFLRTWAPRIGLTGPAAVGHIVRRALARAGIRRSGRGAAHLSRHGLATKIIRQGASLAEIAEVLRHRSQNTTAIYIKYPSRPFAQSLNRGLAEEVFDERPPRCSPTICGTPPGSRYKAPGACQDTGALFGLPRIRGVGVHHVGTGASMGHGTARCPARHMGAAAGHVRRFAAWISTIDARTEVPPPRLLSPRRKRNKPHIFTEQEVDRLMAEAARLASPTGLRALTYTSPIGLLTLQASVQGKRWCSTDPT
jgi:site-specific recombinase XerD